jgi:hypothetical protein
MSTWRQSDGGGSNASTCCDLRGHVMSLLQRMHVFASCAARPHTDAPAGWGGWRAAHNGNVQDHW